MNNYGEFLNQYDTQRDLYRDFIVTTQASQNYLSIISSAVDNRGKLPEKQQCNLKHKYLDCIAKKDGNSDMRMITLVRLLYLLSDSLDDCSAEAEEIIQRILQVLKKFPFWPARRENRCVSSAKIVFWSENHLFMTLSCAYLFYQYQEKQRRKKVSGGEIGGTLLEQKFPDFELDNIECLLLKQYLNAHTHLLFKGVYEINSHGYLHFSFAALLNLFDFADNTEVKSKAAEILESLTIQAMLGTDPLHGIPSFSGNRSINPPKPHLLSPPTLQLEPENMIVTAYGLLINLFRP